LWRDWIAGRRRCGTELNGKRIELFREAIPVCAVICEPVSLLFGQYQGNFRTKQRTGGRKFEKRLQHGLFSKISLIQYQGGTGSAQLLQHRASI
jgi:hypothetical protein